MVGETYNCESCNDKTVHVYGKTESGFYDKNRNKKNAPNNKLIISLIDTYTVIVGKTDKDV